MNFRQNYIPRALDLPSLLARKSYFLLGPRQTGKSWLIRYTLPEVKIYNLLDSSTYLLLSRAPERLRQELRPSDNLIIIDEIQRLPELLNEVHLLIEEKGIRFLLTGSSARKLRRGGVNLLGGRARMLRFHPFTTLELGKHFELTRALNHGMVPNHYFSDEPDLDLEAYTGTYLQEEVVAEGATRNVPAFSRFLKVAAHCNSTIVNFTKVANDAQVPRTTVHEYFQILKDTLILHELPAWKQSRKRKPIASSKYYFFDPGVVRQLQGRIYTDGTTEFGEAFETYIFHELISYTDYRTHEPLYFWRSTSGFEVDFLLSDHTAIEVKASSTVSPRDIKSLLALKEENTTRRQICVCRESSRRTIHGVEIIPYRDFIEELWSGELD